MGICIYEPLGGVLVYSRSWLWVVCTLPQPPPLPKNLLGGDVLQMFWVNYPFTFISFFHLFLSLSNPNHLSLSLYLSLSLLYCSSFDLSFTSYTLTTLFLFSSNSLSILLFFSLNEVLNIFLNIRIDIIYDHRNQCKMLKKNKHTVKQ